VCVRTSLPPQKKDLPQLHTTTQSTRLQNSSRSSWNASKSERQVADSNSKCQAVSSKKPEPRNYKRGSTLHTKTRKPRFLSPRARLSRCYFVHFLELRTNRTHSLVTKSLTGGSRVVNCVYSWCTGFLTWFSPRFRLSTLSVCHTPVLLLCLSRTPRLIWNLSETAAVCD
jgi:hypothetical protein